mmetsp:Transcript_87134/g.182350  ORF Transcript_87134/g.182350 Transcript_87134/m.182350 type:complete len:388 (+) Transcript_87134:98-1261(+)
MARMVPEGRYYQGYDDMEQPAQEAAVAQPDESDPFMELGVALDAKDVDLRRAFFLKGKAAHPDKPGGSKAAYIDLFNTFQKLLHLPTRQDERARVQALRAKKGISATEGVLPPKTEDEMNYEANLRGRALGTMLSGCTQANRKLVLESLPKEDWVTKMLKLCSDEEGLPAMILKKAQIAKRPPALRGDENDLTCVGLRRPKLGGGFYFSMNFKAIRVTTENTSDLDTAIYTHADLFMRKAIATRMWEAGKAVEECIMIFEFVPIPTTISMKVEATLPGGRFQAYLPQLRDFRLATKYRRNAMQLDLSGTKQKLQVQFVKLSDEMKDMNLKALTKGQQSFRTIALECETEYNKRMGLPPPVPPTVPPVKRRLIGKQTVARPKKAPRLV